MIRIKKKYRLLCIVLACVLLAVGLGFLFYHGEWWFPPLHALTMRKNPDLTEVTPEGKITLWPLDELCAREDVTLSNNLLLVNSSHPLPEGYEATLVEYNGAKMHPLMLDPYIALRDNVQAKMGVRIYVASDYRTREEQEAIIAESESGIAAQIGCSEHEAGLALDVYAPYYGGENFLRSRAGRAVNRTCGEYGYIIRYPWGREDVTGISYEPWHIRYVGQPHAEIMMQSGLTLEEYLEYLQPNTWYACGDYLISRRAADALELPDGWTHCDISPDNTGYYVVTLKMN
jgi:LAS superfamily LD-carboxypeptidase LdcB